jgi:hypothetical protein
MPRGLCTTLLFSYFLSLFVISLYVYRFLSPSSFTYVFPSVVLSTASPTISTRLPFLLKPVATFGRSRHYNSRLHNVFRTDSTQGHAVANRDTGHVPLSGMPFLTCWLPASLGQLCRRGVETHRSAACFLCTACCRQGVEPFRVFGYDPGTTHFCFCPDSILSRTVREVSDTSKALHESQLTNLQLPDLR